MVILVGEHNAPFYYEVIPVCIDCCYSQEGPIPKGAGWLRAVTRGMSLFYYIIFGLGGHKFRIKRAFIIEFFCNA
jgi:hypothetical protein